MGNLKWPEGKKCAVMFTFDVDGDTTWENGNRGLPNGEKYIKSLSVGQYGPKRCVDRILDMLESYGVKATFFVPGLTAERYPEVIMRIAEAGHEIGHHGYAHERFAGKTTEEQIEIIEKTQRIFKDLIGHEVTGFRTPSGDWAKITPQLLYERGFRYSSSMRGDDRPYRTVINGEKTDFIEIPTKWEVDDYVAMAYNMYPAEPAGQDRISSYRLVEDNFMREFRGHYREGLCISYMSHPQVIGSPGRIQILKHMLEQITSKEDVWVATGTEVSDFTRTGGKIRMKLERPKWPENKKCSAMITINLNAELFWLQLDPTCKDMPKTLSLGQYGMTRGVDRILEVLEERGIRATFFTPGWVAEQYPDKLKAIVEKGHEIAALGYHHEHMALLSEEEQESAIKKGIQAIEKVCGVTPKGFRSPEGELTLDTLRIAKKNGLVYSSNLCDDDRPYWKDLGEDKILEIPIHWVNYDLPYFAFNYHPAFPAGQGRIANYTGVLNNWKDEFFGCHEYGLCYVLQLDPAAIGAPGRIGLLEELLDYIETFDGVWWTTGEEMYEYCLKSSQDR